MMLDGGAFGKVRVLEPADGGADDRGLPEGQGQPGGGWAGISIPTMPRSGGTCSALDSYGHSGYTGTSVWIDPETRTTVIFLTNRVHPDDTGSIIAMRSKVANVVASVDPGEVTRRLHGQTGRNVINRPQEGIEAMPTPIEREIFIKASRGYEILRKALEVFREYLKAETPPSSPEYYRARNLLKEGQVFCAGRGQGSQEAPGSRPGLRAPGIRGDYGVKPSRRTGSPSGARTRRPSGASWRRTASSGP